MISREEVANEKVKTTGNLNTGTLLHRYFKDYLNMIDQLKKQSLMGVDNRSGRIQIQGKFEPQKRKKDSSMIRLDKAANGNSK